MQEAESCFIAFVALLELTLTEFIGFALEVVDQIQLVEVEHERHTGRPTLWTTFSCQIAIVECHIFVSAQLLELGRGLAASGHIHIGLVVRIRAEGTSRPERVERGL